MLHNMTDITALKKKKATLGSEHSIYNSTVVVENIE